MSTNYTESMFNVPSFARKESYGFDACRDNFEVYQELNEISKEIEECRLRNC